MDGWNRNPGKNLSALEGFTRGKQLLYSNTRKCTEGRRLDEGAEN